MIVDANALAPGATVSADICVVGAGVAGIALAHELRDTDCTLALVESGGLEPNVQTQSLNAGRNIGVPYYELDQSRTRAFGGTSHHWCCELGGTQLGVRLMGLDALDFEKRDWVPNSGWPFPKTELDPHYEKAHAFCEIGPYAYSVDEWKARLPREDIQLMRDSDEVETRVFQFATKTLWYQKYREVLDRSSKVKVYTNATVLKVQTNATAAEVTHLDAITFEGKKLRFQAKRYVLAGGGIETARLMLLSNDVQPGGVGNDHDNVGRYFMEHPHIWTGYVVPNDAKIFNQIGLYRVHSVDQTPIMGKFSIQAKVQRREKLLNFVTSIHPANRLFTLDGVAEFKRCLARLKSGKFSGADREDFLHAMKHLPNLLEHGVQKVRKGLDRNYRHRLNEPNIFLLNPMTEQVPNRESRVLLGPDRDSLGQNRVQLDWRLTSQDIDSIRRSQIILAEELRRHGIGELIVELKDDSIPPRIHGGWHHMGTTRMDDDPKKGVVDRHSRVHGISNLFVAGASVFPTSGYANPVLTLIAMTLRLAQHMKTRTMP
jgi:choline dehydrogenase-like flavoprotein